MISNEPLLAANNAAALAAKASALSSSPLKIIKAPTRYSWLFHFEPSVSFRMLKSRTAITTTNLGLIVVDNNGYDINHLVDQRPSVGFEAGADVLYALTNRLRLKAGLQFNYSRYTAKAVTTVPAGQYHPGRTGYRRHPAPNLYQLDHLCQRYRTAQCFFGLDPRSAYRAFAARGRRIPDSP